MQSSRTPYKLNSVYDVTQFEIEWRDQNTLITLGIHMRSLHLLYDSPVFIKTFLFYQIKTSQKMKGLR